MKRFNFSFGWLELVIAITIVSLPVYALLAILTDLRIDKLRPYLQKASIEAGAKACTEEYERRYMANEHLAVMKRRKRDAALRQFVKRLDSILEME